MVGQYEIPNEMRDFAEKSVEQARKAFDGFMDAAHKAAAVTETQTETAQQQVRSAADSAVSYAEANVSATLDFAQKLVKAKSIEEMTALQAEFARSQFEALNRQLAKATPGRPKSG